MKLLRNQQISIEDKLKEFHDLIRSQYTHILKLEEKVEINPKTLDIKIPRIINNKKTLQSQPKQRKDLEVQLNNTINKIKKSTYLKCEQEIISLKNKLKCQQNLFHILFCKLESNNTSIENNSKI